MRIKTIVKEIHIHFEKTYLYKFVPLCYNESKIIRRLIK